MLFAREPRVWCKALGAGQKAQGGGGGGGGTRSTEAGMVCFSPVNHGLGFDQQSLVWYASCP